jgi:YebC/PmpR family DNA-binding regulatory protein
MSGHSKWSTIKRKKGAADAKRGQVFTKMAKMITAVAKQGGGDPETNFKLRLAIDKAKSVNMPADNIKRAVKRGTGELTDGMQIEEMVYEAYGPGGVALMIEVVTDNKNRTLSEIKHILSENNGRLGEAGSVKWMFESKGVVRMPIPPKEEREKIELAAIDAGAADIQEEDGSLVIYTNTNQFVNVKRAVESMGVKFDSAELELTPANPLEIEDEGTLRKVEKLMEALDEQEDVNEIYSNLVT